MSVDKLPEELVSFEAAGIPVRRWKYPDSGLTVCLVRKQGPVVHGFFGIATEAHDDDGLPHTLEHLVFLGSEEYPYKGVLDTLANRCFARGTNAWTATDHTCYTASHAGAAGFLTLLPVYLDHILYPTLTEHGYTTEVHHVTSDGEDAGVVYCEMQARENTSYSLTEYELQQLMHPEDGYKSETGGRMQNLRESCSHQKVVDYHKTFYRPDGICLIVVGDVDPADLFETLHPVMDKVAAKGALPPKQRAWETPAKPLVAPKNAEVLFPSEDESTGIVRMAWSALEYSQDNFYKGTALEVLGEYLTDTSVSDLQRAFVECEDAAAGAVYFGVTDFNPTQTAITFNSVPKEKLGEIKTKLMGLLSDLGSGAAPFDLSRMKIVLNRKRLELLATVENSPEDIFTDMCLVNYLHDPTGRMMASQFDELARFRQLSDEPAVFWQQLVQDMFVAKPSVCVVGMPSTQKAADLEQAEKERIEARKIELGEEKLKALGLALDAANAANEQEYPTSILTAFPMPSVEKLNFHPVLTMRSSSCMGDVQAPPPEFAAVADAISQLPVRAQFNHIASAFVMVRLMLRTEGLSPRERMLLPLMLEVVLESPVARGAEVVGWEEVVQGLAASSLSSHAAIGFGGGRFACGRLPQLVEVNVHAEAANYAKAVELIGESLFNCLFTAERLRAKINKAINAVPQYKRDGRTTASVLLKEHLFSAHSNYVANSHVHQARFLADLQEQLESDPEVVCMEMDALRRALMCQEDARLIVHVAGNLSLLAQPTVVAPWLNTFLPMRQQAASRPVAMPESTHVDSLPPPPPPLSPVDLSTRCEFAHALRNGFPARSMVCAVASVESGFLLQSTPCVTDFDHADLPAIMVFNEYLTCLEGPFWKQIRGLGLSYSYSIMVDPHDGDLTFQLFKSTNLAGAYEKARSIVTEYVSGETPLSQMMLDTAISTSIFAVVNREDTPLAAAGEAFRNYFRGVEPGYNARLIQKIRAVTPEACIKVIQAYYLKLFDPQESSCAICCNPAKLDEVVLRFSEVGRTLDVLPSLDDALPNCALPLKGSDGDKCGCTRCLDTPFKVGALKQ